MATSRIEFAQQKSKIPCNLCDVFEDVDSFCIDCSFNICKICLKYHFRFYKKHTVVSVFDGIIYKQKYNDQCPNHGEKLKFFCEQCILNICEECVTSLHKGHGIQKVSVHAKTLKQNFSHKIDVRKTQVTQLRANLDSIQQRKLHIKTEAKALVDSVRAKSEKTRKLLDEQEKLIIGTINKEEKQAIEKIEVQCKQIQGLDVLCKILFDSVKKELSCMPDVAVLNFVQEKERKLEVQPDKIDFDLPNLPILTSSRVNQGSDLLGTLMSQPPTKLNIEFDGDKDSKFGKQETTQVDHSIVKDISCEVKTTKCADPAPSLRRQLELCRRFNPTGRAVLSISVADDGMLWVGTMPSQLLLINEKGEEKKKVELSSEPWHMCVTESGDALVSSGKSIDKIPRKGQVSTFVNVSPGKVWGITTTMQGDVFACIDSGSGWKVRKFSSKGKFVVDLDSSLFTSVNRLYYVHTVGNDAVCVQDGVLCIDSVCNLVTVTTSGQAVSRVTRTGKLQEITEAIVWDEYGNILTGTFKGESIHVFSGEGEYTKSYKVEGYRGVSALCMGSGNDLWIGTKSGEILTAKYLQ